MEGRDYDNLSEMRREIQNADMKISSTANIAIVSCLFLLVAMMVIGKPLLVSAGTVATDGAMLRNDASTDAGIIGSLNEGDEVEILDVVQSWDGYNWYYIELENGICGYIRSDLVNTSDEELAAFNVKEEVEGRQEVAETSLDSNNKTDQLTGQIEGEEYNAFRDPNAKFSVRFETEADGTGSWCVYNEDNGSRVVLSDIQSQQNITEASGSHSLGVRIFLALILLWVLSVGMSYIAGRKYGADVSPDQNSVVNNNRPFSQNSLRDKRNR